MKAIQKLQLYNFDYNLHQSLYLSMQQQLFDNYHPQKPQGLAIAKKGKQKLSKNQEAFNRLTQKIEKLQKEISKKQHQFDLALNIYGKEYYAAQLTMLDTMEKFIITLFEIYKKNKLSKPNQRQIKEVIKFHLQEYFEQSAIEPGKKLQQIFSELENIQYDKMMEQEKEQEQADFIEMLQKIKVDTKGFDFKDEAAMAAKIAEAHQKLAALEQEEEEKERKQQAKKRKTAKQTDYDTIQKAVNENKQKNISTIYKQLAKLFHPDLEQDIDRKVEKEILMKELTNAYEAKNLHALLLLELKWIHKENDHLENLTEDKLTVYLQILKEQAMDLENQKNTIIHQPQYSVMVNQFGFYLQNKPVETVMVEVNNLKEEIMHFENDIKNFESETGLRYVNQMIKQWKKKDDDLDDEEMLRMFFG